VQPVVQPALQPVVAGPAAKCKWTLTARPTLSLLPGVVLHSVYSFLCECECMCMRVFAFL